MAATGIILRRAMKADIIANPPKIGEMVYALDTDEHGWIDSNLDLIWKNLAEGEEVDPDTVIAPNDVLPVLDGSNLTHLPGGGELVKDGVGYRINGLTSDVLGENAVNLSISGEASGIGSHVEGSNNVARGDYSHAEGHYYNTASGIAAHAEGFYTVASGDYSHSSGNYTRSVGEASFSGGKHTVAESDFSFATGVYTTASGDGAFVAGSGYSSSSRLTSTGDGSFAAGYNGYYSTVGASGTGSVLMGYFGGSSFSSGRGSISLGYNTSATEDGQIALGFENIGKTDTVLEVGMYTSNPSTKGNAFEIFNNGTATLPEATTAEIDARGVKAIPTVEWVNANAGGGGGGELVKDGVGYRIDGLSVGTLGTNAVNLGSISSIAQGAYSVALGRNATAYASDTVAVGYNTNAYATNSVAIGFNCYAGYENTVAIGHRASGYANGSVALGYGTKSSSEFSCAVGRYNESYSDTSFEVGNGTNGAAGKLNVFEVYKDGRVKAPQLTTALVNDSKSLVTKEYVELNGVGGSRPGTPAIGQFYFDTTLVKPIWYSGSAWVDATGTTV